MHNKPLLYKLVGWLDTHQFRPEILYQVVGVADSDLLHLLVYIALRHCSPYWPHPHLLHAATQECGQLEQLQTMSGKRTINVLL